MVRTKICGITRGQDALKAVEYGAWALGFIFYKKSPRSIGAFKAKKILDQLPPFVTPVGVFVNAKEGAVRDVAEFCGLTTLQFHGEESPEFCKRFKKKYQVIKAIRVGDQVDVEALKRYAVDAFLFDTFVESAPGGTGQTFNWSVIKKVKSLQVPIILTGGLHYNNVVAAIYEVRPYAVDTCSGVEVSPGVKNDRSMREFLERVRL